MPGTWKPLTNQPTFNTSTMILLTDGRVMVQEEGTAHWHALTPDSKGSYINGQWSTLHDMSFWRRYYSLGMLKNGRVFVCGGEQSGAGGDTNKGEIYDPVLDAWTPTALPPWPQVGDAASTVLPDGRIMVGALLSGACIIYDPSTNSWSTTGAQPGRTNEETWILLPDNTILAVQCFPPYQGVKYVISSGSWQNEGALPVTIVDPVMSEVGPGMLLYNGKVIFTGAANSGGHGKTVLYTPPSTPTGVGTWTAGPNIPTVGGKVIVCNDCPGTLMPNGNLLFAAANFVNNSWGSPVLFFEYDPTTNTITQAPSPPNNATYPYGANSAAVYWSRMMLLPSGEVMFSASSSNVQIYQPSGGPLDGWRPTITSVTPLFANQYLLQGTQLNGLSQANIYGDDCCPATNYPLLQLTNVATQEVFYCRTHDFSTMGVATGSSLQSCRFTLTGVPPCRYELRVIANGIASHPFCFEECHRPKSRCAPVKCECGCCKSAAECDPCSCAERTVDPDMAELRVALRSLQNGLDRLSAIVQASGLPPIGEGSAKQAGKDQIRKEEGEKNDEGGDAKKTLKKKKK